MKSLLILITCLRMGHSIIKHLPKISSPRSALFRLNKAKYVEMKDEGNKLEF